MFEEYEFVLVDGTSRYEMIDLAVPARLQIFAFKRMHGAVAFWPLKMLERVASHRQRLRSRFRATSAE